MMIEIARKNAPLASLYVEKVTAGDERERPAAFILPGGPGADHTAYLDYASLRNVADIVFHDPRGTGQSRVEGKAMPTMSEYIDDIESLRDALGLQKIIVIGKSYGSMCALGYALRYPHSVSKLVLAAGAPSYRFLETAKKTLKRVGTPEQQAVCTKLWTGSFANHDEMMLFFRLTRSLYSMKVRAAGVVVDLTMKSKQFSYQTLNAGFRHTFWKFDYENDLHRVACPTLILAGQEDWINDVKYAEFMAARIPHSQLRIFQQAGHAIETDVGDVFYQAISEFIG